MSMSTSVRIFIVAYNSCYDFRVHKGVCIKVKKRTAVICQGRICGKDMSADADGRLVKTGMIVHPEGESSM